MSGPAEPLLVYWRAQDALFEHVEAAWWGAVISDTRFPAVRDANYARVDADRPVGLAEIEERLLPAMRRSAAEHTHAVLFRPEDQIALLAEASTRGERIAWDLVMRASASAVGDREAGEEVTAFDEGFWTAFRQASRIFGVVRDEELRQLETVERDLMVPAGRRWFGVRERGGHLAFAAVLVLDAVGYLDHVVTFPEARRRGFAEALIRRALAEAPAAGADAVVLLTEPASPAVRLYERCGFERAGYLASWVAPPPS